APGPPEPQPKFPMRRRCFGARYHSARTPPRLSFVPVLDVARRESTDRPQTAFPDGSSRKGGPFRQTIPAHPVVPKPRLSFGGPTAEQALPRALSGRAHIPVSRLVLLHPEFFLPSASIQV